MEGLEALYKKSKILFGLLLVPLVILLILALFIPTLRAWIVKSAEKLIKDTKAKDESLKQEADSANNEANTHKENADTVGAKVEEIKKDDDADWHKKM